MIQAESSNFSWRALLGLIFGIALIILFSVLFLNRFYPYYAGQSTGGVMFTPEQLTTQTGNPLVYNAIVEATNAGFADAYPDTLLGLLDSHQIYHEVAQVGGRYLIIQRIRANGFFSGSELITGTIKPWDETIQNAYYGAMGRDAKFNDQTQFYPIYLDMIDNENTVVWLYHMIASILFLVIGLIWFIASLNLMFAPKPTPPQRPQIISNRPLRNGKKVDRLL